MTDISVGISTACALLGFDNGGEGMGCLAILVSEITGIKNNVEFTSAPQ